MLGCILRCIARRQNTIDGLPWLSFIILYEDTAIEHVYGMMVIVTENRIFCRFPRCMIWAAYCCWLQSESRFLLQWLMTLMIKHHWPMIDSLLDLTCFKYYAVCLNSCLMWCFASFLFVFLLLFDHMIHYSSNKH